MKEIMVSFFGGIDITVGRMLVKATSQMKWSTKYCNIMTSNHLGIGNNVVVTDDSDIPSDASSSRQIN
jgi:hypothetical protein